MEHKDRIMTQRYNDLINLLDAFLEDITFPDLPEGEDKGFSIDPTNRKTLLAFLREPIDEWDGSAYE